MSKLKIYIPSNEPFEYIKNSVFSPAQFYTENNNIHLIDTTQDIHQNISPLLGCYYELSVLYWAWKNDQSDYIGFFKPNRYLSFSDENKEQDSNGDIIYDSIDEMRKQDPYFSQDYMINIIKEFDLIIPNPIQASSVNQLYLQSPYKYQADLDHLLNIISKHYPEYSKSAIVYLQGTYYYPYNLFIMKKEVYSEYSEFLFSILLIFEKEINMQNFGNDMKKVLVYIAEILLGIYITYLKSKRYKISIYQRLYIHDVNIEEELRPAFNHNNIPVVLTCSESYFLYVCVTLQSIIETISNKYNYDIIIVHADVSDKSRNLFLRMVQEYKNIRLRFYNIHKKVKSCTFQTTHPFVAHVTGESFYRIFAQSVFQHYNKVIWLDSDMIIKRDISTLYNIDIGDNLLAAVIDAGWYALYNEASNHDFRNYVAKCLCLSENAMYFQQGVLVINIEEFNRTFDQQELIDFASQKEFMFYDQDVFNVKCQSKVYYLDMKWNVLSDVGGDRVRAITSLSPEQISKQYMIARKDPYIIHFAGGTKPWQDPSIDFAYEFWNTARRTEAYEYLIKNISKEEAYGSFIISNKMAKHKVESAIKKHIKNNHT